MDSQDRQSEPRRARSWQRRLRGWALAALILLAMIGGGVNLAQLHLDEQIRTHIEELLSEANPHLLVQVKRARRLNSTVIEVRDLAIGNPDEPTPFLLIDEAQIVCDTRLQHLIRDPNLKITEINLYRPRVRARVSRDGDLDLGKLLAFPRSTGDPAPVQIIDGEIELQCDCGQDFRPLRFRDVNLHVAHHESTADRPGGMRIRGQFSGAHVRDASFDFRRESASEAWTITGRVNSLDFSRALLANLPEGIAERLQPLQDLRATASFDYSVQNGGEEQSFRYRVEGQLADGRISDPDFPYAFTDLQAQFVCANGMVELRDVRARSGQADLRLAFRGGGFQVGEPFALTAVTQRLPLDERLASALPPDVRRIWDRFQPAGEIDATLTLAYDGTQWKPELDVNVSHLDFTFDAFPYRVDGAHGAVRLRGDELVLDLQTTISGQRAELHGKLRLFVGEKPQGWIELNSAGPVPLDEKIIRAMRPEHQEIVRAFNASGLVQCQARFVRDEHTDLEWSKRIHVTISRGAMQYSVFPYPLNRMNGRLLFHDDGWTIERLQGYNDSAYITLSGNYTKNADGGDLSVLIQGVDVSLDDSLRLALPPHARDVWASLRPRGSLDSLVARVHKSARSPIASYHIQAKKVDADDARGSLSLTPKWLPYRWDRVSGEFEFRDGSVVFRDVHGVHGRSEISLAAEGGFSEDDWKIDLTRVSLENAEADSEFLSAVRPATLRNALLQAKLSGPLRLEGSLGFSGRRGDPKVASHWDMYVDLENGSLQLGVPVRSIRGGVRFRGKYDGERLASSGAMAVDSMIVRDMHLTRVHGPLWLDETRILFGADAFSIRPELQRQSILAHGYEGRIAFDGQVALQGTNAFHVKMRMDDGNLAKLVRQFGSPTETLKGRVAARLDLWGNGRGSHTWSGGGEVHLTEADIYELPLMISLFRSLSVTQPDTTAFTNADAFFRLQGEHVYFDRIDFSGDVVTLRGTGEMDLQRHLNLQFYAAIGRDRLYIPVIRPLLGETSRSFLLIEVGGTMDRPNVRRTAFPEISERLRQLLPPEVTQQQLRPPLLPGLDYVLPDSLKPLVDSNSP